MTNLGEKVYCEFIFEKFDVKFVEIIRLLNLVAKWMDNLVTQLSEQFSRTFMLKIW